MIAHSAPAAPAAVEAEQTLIEQAMLGDRSAFGELVTRHREAVINMIYRMSADIHIAEDIAQEAFIRAWQKLPGYRPTAPFRNWVMRIGHNAYLDDLRRVKDTLGLESAELPSPDAGPESKAVQAERAAQVQQAISALPEASRSVLVLREYEGFSYQDIADILQIPIGTVMSRLSYARGHIRKTLAPLMEEA